MNYIRLINTSGHSLYSKDYSDVFIYDFNVLLLKDKKESQDRRKRYIITCVLELGNPTQSGSQGGSVIPGYHQ